METLRLFPLNAVLFPGQLLPLHIFEPRYRQMIGECILHAQAFGVVLIRSGAEVGGAAEPYDVGTTAHIVQVESEADGRMNLLCVGNARFRIARLLHDKPYLSGRVEEAMELPAFQQEFASRLKEELEKLVQGKGQQAGS